MRATWVGGGRTVLALLVVAVLAGAGQAAPIPKDEEKQLRDKALELNQITGDDPIAGMILTLLEDKDNSKKLLSVAHKLAKEKGKDQPFNINATYILARVAHGLKDVDISEYFYRQNAAQALKLQSVSRLARAYDSLIVLLFENKRYDDSEKVCKEFLELPGDEDLERMKILMMRRMIQTRAKQGKTDEAIKLTDRLIRDFPRSIMFRSLKGWVLREAGKTEEAAKFYEDLLEYINKDDKLDKEQKDEYAGGIRYTLSGVYVDLKKIDKAAEHLKALLAKDEKNPTYNNDLGFIWADHDMNLDEAEKLVRRAIDEERKLRKKLELPKSEDHDNSAYLDSLGWVLYKKKKFKEALDPLLEAIKYEDGQHLEIYDHLADVYAALGEKEKAVETWKKGLTCEPQSKRDEARKIEVEKKMKKLAEK